MAEQIFSPVNSPLRGSIEVPGDKSIASRAIFLAAMAEGKSHIYNVPKSLDVMTVANAVKDLGAKVEIKDSSSSMRNVNMVIEGWGKKGPQSLKDVIQCDNSATCARVLLGILAPFDIKQVIDGDESLHRRPFMRIVDPLMQMGAQLKVVAQKTSEPQRSSLPMEIQGSSSVSPIFYEMPVASSQAKTSILFAGANINGDTSVIEPCQSRNHGELLLKAFGADLDIDEDMFCTTIHGPANLHCASLHIPGDVSSAAYYLTAAALVPGSKITIKNVGINKTRLGFVRALQRMGSRIEIKEHDRLEMLRKGYDYCGEPVGDITVQYAGRLNNIIVQSYEIPQMIDEIPILAMAAACAEGESIFYGVKELKLKESNRIHAISEGLTLLGTKAFDKADTLYVEGGIDIEAQTSTYPTEKEIKLFHHFDHRLAIVWALMGKCGYIPIRINNFDISNVSYPHFMDDFNALVLNK